MKPGMFQNPQMRQEMKLAPRMMQSLRFQQAPLPELRADFLLGDRYRPPQRRPLPCALHVFGGRDDSVAVSALTAWEAECSGSFHLEMCAGGHFFLHRQRADFLQHLLALCLDQREQAPRVSLPSLRALG